MTMFIFVSSSDGIYGCSLKMLASEECKTFNQSLYAPVKEICQNVGKSSFHEKGEITNNNNE